jgi:UDP-N-acetylmuramate dehydrogenase
MNFQKNFDLTEYNTFGIEAKAAHYACFVDSESLIKLLREIPNHPITILGGGSNMLFTQNLLGTILHNKILGKEVIFENDDYLILRVGAGENWHNLVTYAVENNWGGLENLSLIPGCVGASPMQNIGAYGVEIKDVLEQVDAIHIPTLDKHHFSNEDCQFAYRESVFKRALKNQYVITHVSFRLHKKHQIHAEYGAIKEILAARRIENPKIQDISQAVIEIRTSKIPNPKEIGNAGSFFKNPVVPITTFEALRSKHQNVPHYPIDELSVKIPAGWLIETAGWKGKSFGNYGVHKQQALVLVNFGGATGQEIYDLSEKIIVDIQEKFHIQLEREVNIY